jgi:3-dehydroquinate synthase
MIQKVALQDYTVYVGEIWQAWNVLLQRLQPSKLVILVDENSMVHCLPIFRANTNFEQLFVIEIPAGEQHKNIDTCQVIWSKMMDANIDRKALMVNLGGGVIGDMGGFCASTFKRGIDFVQFPTTLLAQVDASIGGKLGIDFQKIKNSIGVFANPKAVFIDPRFLHTLPSREIRSGFAEIIKHSLIYDAQQWQQMQAITDLQQVDWTTFLIPSLLIKQQIVEADPYEKGLRKALNFGHTIGHAVESYFLQSERPLLHGEAIAIGMISEAYLAHKKLGLSYDELENVSRFLLRIYDEVIIPEAAFSWLIEMMKKDKKNEQDLINFSLINPIGKVHINQTSHWVEIVESLHFYNELMPQNIMIH